MTPVDRTCDEFERLEKLLTTFTRPDYRTENLFSECSEVLALSSEELKPYLTPTQIAQLKHAYWHFMDSAVEENDQQRGMFEGTYLEDVCQHVMHFGHDVIRNPEKYLVK